jgi:hypothetical protein
MFAGPGFCSAIPRCASDGLTIRDINNETYRCGKGETPALAITQRRGHRDRKTTAPPPAGNYISMVAASSVPAPTLAQSFK